MISNYNVMHTQFLFNQWSLGPVRTENVKQWNHRVRYVQDGQQAMSRCRCYSQCHTKIQLTAAC
jgi:hypothetical protein